MAKAKYSKNDRGVWETRMWDGTYNKDGTKHRKRLVSRKSSADLERQVTQLRNTLENGQYVRNTDTMFLDYARQWIETKKGTREKNTQVMYQNIVEKHLAFLEGVKLSDIRNSHFQMAINSALDKPRTCQQIAITFRQILKMAVADNCIGPGMYDLICADISLPKYVRVEKRTLTPIEKDAIRLANFTDRERAFVFLIYACGLRRGEALALSKFDFSFTRQECTVSITKALIFDCNASEIKPTPKTANSIRKVPVPASTAAFLRSYMSTLTGVQLFTCRDGSLITKSSYDKMWASIVKKMNYAAGGTDAIPVITGLTAHIFRHNYCSNLCYHVPAISIKKIAQLMGDTEKMVINVYNHIIEEKEDVTTVINDVMSI